MAFKIILVIAILFGGWKFYSTERNARAEAANAVRYEAELAQLSHKQGVTLFTAAWCGYCKKLKERLDAGKVPYVEYDIELTPQGRMYFSDNKLEGVPVIVVDGNMIQGYDLNKMPAAFAGAGFHVTGL